MLTVLEMQCLRHLSQNGLSQNGLSQNGLSQYGNLLILGPEYTEGLTGTLYF
jgi:hypothetical protein